MQALLSGRRGFTTAVLAIATTLAVAAPASAKTADAHQQRDRGPVAHAAFCPPCIPVGVVALRAAITAAKASRYARAARLMSAASRQFATDQRVRRAAIQKAVDGARRVAPHGSKWLKRNWANLPKDAKWCLGGGAAMLTKDYAEDGKIDETEFKSFILFHYPLADWTEINWNTEFDFDEKKDSIVAACLAGMVGGRVSG